MLAGKTEVLECTMLPNIDDINLSLADSVKSSGMIMDTTLLMEKQVPIMAQSIYFILPPSNEANDTQLQLSQSCHADLYQSKPDAIVTYLK